MTIEEARQRLHDANRELLQDSEAGRPMNPELAAELAQLTNQVYGGAEQTPPPPVRPVSAAMDSHWHSAYQSDYRRRTAKPAYHDAFNNYLRHLAVPDAAASMQREMDVLQEGVDTLGGFLVPADRVAGIFTRLRARSSIFDATGLRPTQRDRVEIMRVIPASGSDEQIYSSAFIGSWVAEIPASTAGEIEPTFGNIVIPVRKLRTKTFLSHDEIADAELDLLQFLEQDGGANLALVADKGIIAGTGVNGQPMGIMVSPDISTVDVEGSTTDTISNTTTDLGSAPKLIDLVANVPSQYSANGKWLMHRLTEAKIRKLVDGNGRFIWAPGFGELPGELLSYPVLRSDFCPQDGTDGNKVLAFGDFEEAYLKVLRSAVSAQVDPFSKSDIEQTILYLRMRMGGNLRNPDALRIGVV